MVTPVNSSSAASGADLSRALGKNPAMGRDAFLKLLVAQLKNQDPLKPQDNSAFVAELAQFSSLEQSMGVNDRLDQMMLQNQGMANADVVNMVGKNATVKGSLITTDGSGVGVPVAFSQDRVSDKTVVQIQDANGKIVRTLDLGTRPVGMTKITWDGRSDDGLVQPAGTYAVSVKSNDADGGTVSVSQETTGTITGVAFDKGYPVLRLSNGVSAPVSDLLRVETPPKTP
ncbi:MAG TPA: flagellar hook assembly protein FlgD [Polyangiaceae bacterium]|nr:flagellar hook assembly protein FlgD [Polyangiaceae bacterium]